MNNRVMSAGEWAMILTLALVWSCTFYFTEVALLEMSPFPMVLCRVGLAAGALWIICLFKGIKPPADLRLWCGFITMGLLNNVIPFSLITWGQTEITSGLASILNAMTPIFTVVLAHFLTRDEKITPNRVVGILAGFAGVIVMIGPGALSGLGAQSLAQIAILCAALSYGLASIFGRRFKSHPPILLAAGQLSGSTLVMVFVVVLTEPVADMTLPGTTTIAALLAFALISTAFAYILYFRILATAGATNLMLVTLMMPPLSILIGIFALGETLDMKQISGMVLIGFGLIAIDGRALARFIKRPSAAD